MLDDQTDVDIDAGSPSYRIYANSSTGECGKKLYLNTTTADVHFSFDGTTVQVGAHKSVLAVTSDVFQAMFYGELRENGRNIHEPNVTDAAFMEFLQYFYLDRVKLTAENIEMVLELGDKYNVEKCVNDCVDFLIDCLSDENVCSRLCFAIHLGQMELTKACEQHILLNTAAVLDSADFLACDRQVLAQILKMKLFSCPEMKVFEAMMAWVKAKSKQNVLTPELIEANLGALFYEIRFASMKIDEFCALATKYNSILSKHYRTIADMIVLPQHGRCGKFNAQPRHINWNEDDIVKCDRKTNSEIRFGHNTITNFSTNEPLLLGSFTCAKVMVYNEITENYNDLVSYLLVNVKIVEIYNTNGDEEDFNVLLQMVASLKSETTNVRLPHPILIKPDFVYSIIIAPFPDPYYFLAPQVQEQVDIESDIRVRFHKCKVDENELVIELITSLDFNRI